MRGVNKIIHAKALSTVAAIKYQTHVSSNDNNPYYYCFHFTKKKYRISGKESNFLGSHS